MRRFFFCLVVGTSVAWIALLLTSQGMLVWSEIRPPTQAGGQASLDCTFFTGLETVTIQWHQAASPIHAFGRRFNPASISRRTASLRVMSHFLA